MNSHYQSGSRAILLKIYTRALAAVNGRRAVSAFLRQQPLTTSTVRAIAIGKAAASMMQGVLDEAADQLDAGLVITKRGHTEDFSASAASITQIESAHPYPDARSLAAGAQLLQFIQQLPPASDVLFLISGGASALVEVLPTDVEPQQLHDFNVWLLAQGWPIEVMNALRQSISLIKAGRLARMLGGHQVLQLLISDVPGDDPAVIGSGLLVARSKKTPLPDGLPDWLTRLQQPVPAAPAATDPCFAHIRSFIIASNTQLRVAAARVAGELGYKVQCNAFIDGDAVAQGQAIADDLLAGPPGIYLWGGETLVNLPAQPGQGGRCQQLALAAARQLAGQHGISLLALGSDGTDGPGDVAGALVDGQTLERARDAGAAEPEQALRDADAGRFLAASGDLVDTGPTGTNVMDLVIGLKT
jgi:glycerate 2-kinase